ncbi:hypothetical protein [Shewanella subflava]|uniref:Uncharacterized protein n=1 Tax=Shewanella subflava TaxID=2986476 RepID=A0ABT3I5H4_9GAMM|nr:hypothetical protein [Shewanella subflava]MCW3171252.1 hypothetical protein [Shewanella subflava]
MYLLLVHPKSVTKRLSLAWSFFECALVVLIYGKFSVDVETTKGKPHKASGKTPTIGDCDIYEMTDIDNIRQIAAAKNDSVCDSTK